MRKILCCVSVAVVLTGLTGALQPSSAFGSGPVLTWSTRTPMPTARYSATAATTIDGDIVVFGGLTQAGAGNTANVERFHPATNSWTFGAAMPTSRYGAAAATTTDGTILVVGGYPAGGGDATNVVEAYNPASNTWSARANLPTTSSGPGGVRGPDGTIYMIGGYPGCCFNYLNTIYAYNEATDSWTSRAPMPTPREAPAVALGADGKIYVVGGNGSGPVDHVVEEYDPVTNTWQSKAPVPVSVRGVPLIPAPNGKLYVFGFDMTGAVLQYDPATDTWAAVEPMPTPSLGPVGALAGDGSIYIVGGFVYPAAQTVAVNERASFVNAPEPFTFTGFLQPVDNQPMVNIVKAGAAVPVKFSLDGDQGLNIFAAGHPASQQVSCTSGAPAAPVEPTADAGSSGFSYDPTSGQYTYVWKTDKTWANTCRTLALRLIDGTDHYANFKFK
jgi:N-acetylneuraminic acid mutarotase